MKLKTFIVTIASFAIAALPAFASTTQSFLTLDGKIKAQVASGDTVQAKLQFTNTGTSAVQSVWVEIPGSGFPGYCANIEPDQNTTGPHTATFGVDTTGASEGTWDVRTIVFDAGTPSGANDSCDTTIGSNSGHTFFSKLTITDQQSTGSNSNNTGSGNTSNTGGSNASLQNVIEQLIVAIANMNKPTYPPVGAPSPMCNMIPMGNTSMLQQFLMNNGQASGFYAIGVYTPTGFYGPVTTAALANFKIVNHCQ